MFQLNSKFKPMGDQQKVVDEISNSIKNGNKYQTIKGVTGSGKTFCMANIIKEVNKPTLVISHNKTLAAQLYSEFKELFPNNAVEYFVSHYKYFQPECYLPVHDKYIAKETMVNDEIERMRQHAAQSLLIRKDIIIVASVSALFGLGNPKVYHDDMITIKINDNLDRDELILNLVKKQYQRTANLLHPGYFRVNGDTINIMLSTDADCYYRICMFDDEIESIEKLNMSNEIIEKINELNVFGISTYIVKDNDKEVVCNNIKNELNEVYNKFINNGELLYAQRIHDRTLYDIEMIKEIGWCKGMEAYQRYLSDRPAGFPPYSLIDFFPKDYLMFIDESHATIPQVKSIGNQNDSIKQNLINYGFRLPSCVDNRCLNFKEFEEIQNQVVFVSATPHEYELDKSKVISEQIIRPTGLLDPIISIRPIKGQIDNIYEEIIKTVKNNNKVLITVLTQNMAETLSDYLIELGVKSCYLHANVPTIERINIINGLQQNKYDVLIGCNLLREGLSISNCELVIILDADKEGFLRNKTSLIQTIGRAARNSNGRAILYADTITKSMKEAIEETNRNRQIQINYNKVHNIIPKSTDIKLINNVIGMKPIINNKDVEKLTTLEIKEKINKYHKIMMKAANENDYETAIVYRDMIQELENKLF